MSKKETRINNLVIIVRRDFLGVDKRLDSIENRLDRFEIKNPKDFFALKKFSK